MKGISIFHHVRLRDYTYTSFLGVLGTQTPLYHRLVGIWCCETRLCVCVCVHVAHRVVSVSAACMNVLFVAGQRYHATFLGSLYRSKNLLMTQLWSLSSGRRCSPMILFPAPRWSKFCFFYLILVPSPMGDPPHPNVPNLSGWSFALGRLLEGHRWWYIEAARILARYSKRLPKPPCTIKR